MWSAAVCMLVALAALAGSIGWFAGDRAARWAAVERQVDSALQEATQLMQQAKWPEARAWLERADGLLAGGGSRDEVRRRVSAMRNDVDLVQCLEEARLEKAAVLDGGMTYAEVDTRYAQVFRDYGIDVDELGIDKAAERIRQLAVCAEVTAMIDDWAIVRRRALGSDNASWKRLLAVARAADPNDTRSRLRVALELGDQDVFRELVNSEEVANLPSPTVVLLAHGLAHAGEREVGVSVLRTAIRMHPGDFWVNYMAAHLLHGARPPRFGEMVQYSRVTLALRPHSAAAAVQFGDALRHNGDLNEAIATLRNAIRLKPDHPNVYLNLGVALIAKGASDEASAMFREAIRLKPDFALAHSNLGSVLARTGAIEEAIVECREAIRLQPDLAEAHYGLATILLGMRALDEAISECREAIRLKPDYTDAHVNLGNAYILKGLLDKALTELREAIRLEADNPIAHLSLANALQDKGVLEEAIAEIREAIRLKPDYSDAYNNLGIALKEKGNIEEAIAAYGKAISLTPDDPDPHSNLGMALYDKRAYVEAVAEFHEAIRLKPDHANAHNNLAVVLHTQGDFEGAIVEFRRAIELNPGSRTAAKQLRQCERLVELKGRLDAILSGEEKSKGVRETIEFAKLCLFSEQRMASAARFYAEAFATQPELAADLDEQHRYNAASAAALAACGQGEDAGAIGDEERARLRQQALDWLRADLESWRKVLEGAATADTPAKVVKTLKHWQQDKDLAGVRDVEAIAMLPEAEREAWGRLWREVAEVLKQVSGQ